MNMAIVEKKSVAGVVGRYYDPATAQFTTPDPLFALTGSRYGYAGNDPINVSDPTGLFHIPGTSYCVDIGDSNCHSNADGQSLNWEDTKTGLGLTAGIVSVGTGLGAIGIGGVALGATSLVTGLGAAALDLRPCIANGPTSAACLGLGLGGAGAVLGAAPLGITLGVVTEESAFGTLLTGLGVGGLSMGLAGLFLDTTVAVFGDPTLDGTRCHEP